MVAVDGEKITLATTDTDNERAIAGRLLEGDFPKCDQVIPDHTDESQYSGIAFDHKLFQALAKYLAGETGAVNVYIPKDNSKEWTT